MTAVPVNGFGVAPHITSENQPEGTFNPETGMLEPTFPVPVSFESRDVANPGVWRAARRIMDEMPQPFRGPRRAYVYHALEAQLENDIVPDAKGVRDMVDLVADMDLPVIAQRLRERKIHDSTQWCAEVENEIAGNVSTRKMFGDILRTQPELYTRSKEISGRCQTIVRNCIAQVKTTLDTLNNMAASVAAEDQQLVAKEEVLVRQWKERVAAAQAAQKQMSHAARLMQETASSQDVFFRRFLKEHVKRSANGCTVSLSGDVILPENVQKLQSWLAGRDVPHHYQIDANYNRSITFSQKAFDDLLNGRHTRAYNGYGVNGSARVLQGR